MKMAVHLPRTNCNLHQLSGHAGKLALTEVTARYGHISFFNKMGQPALHREVTSHLSRTVVAWIGRGGTIALGTMIA
jgi:hypothetical protein